MQNLCVHFNFVCNLKLFSSSMFTLCLSLHWTCDINCMLRHNVVRTSLPLANGMFAYCKANGGSLRPAKRIAKAQSVAMPCTGTNYKRDVEKKMGRREKWEQNNKQQKNTAATKNRRESREFSILRYCFTLSQCC